MKMKTQTLSLLSLVALFGLSAAVFAPIRTWALPPTTLCVGTDTTTYSPGLRLFPRTSNVAWTDDYPTCVSTTPGIVSASSPGGGYTTSLSCLDILTSDPVDGSQRIDWSNGQYSIFSWEAEDTAIINAAGQTTITTVNATVTEGLYLGQPLVEVIVTVEPSLLACLLEPGLTESTGPITLMVLPE